MSAWELDVVDKIFIGGTYHPKNTNGKNKRCVAPTVRPKHLFWWPKLRSLKNNKHSVQRGEKKILLKNGSHSSWLYQACYVEWMTTHSAKSDTVEATRKDRAPDNDFCVKTFNRRAWMGAERPANVCPELNLENTRRCLWSCRYSTLVDKNEYACDYLCRFGTNDFKSSQSLRPVLQHQTRGVRNENAFVWHLVFGVLFSFVSRWQSWVRTMNIILRCSNGILFSAEQSAITDFGAENVLNIECLCLFCSYF